MVTIEIEIAAAISNLQLFSKKVYSIWYSVSNSNSCVQCTQELSTQQLQLPSDQK